MEISPDESEDEWNTDTSNHDEQKRGDAEQVHREEKVERCLRSTLL